MLTSDAVGFQVVLNTDRPKNNDNTTIDSNLNSPRHFHNTFNEMPAIKGSASKASCDDGRVMLES